METLFKKINQKINGAIWSLISSGVLLIMLAILIAWTDFILRLLVSLFVLLIAYIFIYIGYKLKSVKKEITKHFKF
jgi:ABC-type bacteriocin/lantibiotic exporter with double-glycine peptidase domain